GCGGAAGRARSLLSPLLAYLPGLASLAAHALAGIADALAFVRLRWPELANIRRNLANPLLIDALHENARTFDCERNPLGRRDDDRVREAERKLQVRTLELRAITHALHF